MWAGWLRGEHIILVCACHCRWGKLVIKVCEYNSFGRHDGAKKRKVDGVKKQGKQGNQSLSVSMSLC